MVGLREAGRRVRVGRTQIGTLMYFARRLASRVDDVEVRKGRQLLRRMRSRPTDVLYLGDSVASFVSSADDDVRSLADMIAAALPDGRSYYAVHGGSYHPALYDGYVRLLGGTDARPLVIVGLCARLQTLPWIRHPIWGHREATDYLARVDPHQPAWRVHAAFRRPSPADWAAFEALPFPTWAGELTIGDYVRRIRALTNPADRDERDRLLYAYHHGGTVVAGRPMEGVTNLARRLRDLGVRVVIYQSPVPVEYGEKLWGPPLRDLAVGNLATLDDALRAGYGPGLTILQTGLAFGTDEFIDPHDGSEHLNDCGRRRLASIIGEAVATCA